MMPGRLGAEYVAEDDTRQIPVMLHRAIVGSMERFIGILIEHHAGALPLWLAPVQAVVLNITDRRPTTPRRSSAALREAGFRVAADLRNEKITYKIREHSCKSCRTCWSSATRSSRLIRWPCVPAAARIWGRCPSTPCWRASDRRSRRVAKVLIPLWESPGAPVGARPFFVVIGE